MRWVVWRDTYMDLVSNHHLDTVHFHSSGKTSRDSEIIVAMNFHDSTAQHLYDLTWYLN